MEEAEALENESEVEQPKEDDLIVPKEEEEEEEDTDENPDELVICMGIKESLETSQFQTYDLSEQELRTKTERTISRVPSIYKDTMLSNWKDIIDALETMDKELFITFQTAGTLKQAGLCIAGISEDKAYIFHISTHKVKNFETALNLVNDYIFSNSNVDELIIKARHLENDEGKLKVPLEIVANMKTCGFRWKRLENT